MMKDICVDVHMRNRERWERRGEGEERERNGKGTHTLFEVMERAVGVGEVKIVLSRYSITAISSQ
jgi:hypothetical protein